MGNTHKWPDVVKAELPPLRVKKFASIVRTGASFEVLDGSTYRVLSTLEIAGVPHYRLASKTEVISASQTQVERMVPLSEGMVRVAGLVRWAFSSSYDIDGIIKEAIKHAGFPVDTSRNWNSWFRNHYFNKIQSKDPSLVDDAIQELIIKYLYTGNYLKNNMDAKRLNQSKDVAEQITQYLTTLFTNKRSEAQKYVEKQTGNERKQRNVKNEETGERVQEKNPSGALLYWTSQGIGRQKTTQQTQWPVWEKEKVEDAPTTESENREGEEGEYSIFDQTEDQKATAEFDKFVQDEDLQTFRDNFFDFIRNDLKERGETAKIAEDAFDLAIESAEGRQSDIVAEWCNKTNRAPSSLKVTMGRLGRWLQEYIKAHPEAENAHEFVKLVINTLKSREGQMEGDTTPVEAHVSSLNLAGVEEQENSEGQVPVVAGSMHNEEMNSANVPPLIAPNVVGADENQQETWSSSNGKIQLRMTMDQAKSVSHSGECDEDVNAMKQVPEIAAQLDQLDPEVVASELSDYWSDDELTDPTKNLSRLLWLAGGDIVEDASEKQDNGPNLQEEKDSYDFPKNWSDEHEGSDEDDDEGNCKGCGEPLNNAEGRYCGGSYCPKDTDPSDMKESSEDKTAKRNKSVIERLQDKTGYTIGYSNKKDEYIVKSGYFYTHGFDEDKLAANVLKVIPEAQITDKSNHWNAWPRDSWFEVRFKVPETSKDDRAKAMGLPSAVPGAAGVDPQGNIIPQQEQTELYHGASAKKAYRDPLLETEGQFADKRDPLFESRPDLQDMGGYAPSKGTKAPEENMDRVEVVNVLKQYEYVPFSGKDTEKQYWKSPIGTVVTLLPDGSWKFSDGVKGTNSRQLMDHLLKYHHKIVPKVGADHRFQHDAELCVFQVLNGGFSQLWGNYGKCEGYNVPSSLVRTAKFFEENNRPDVAAIFSAAAKIDGDDSNIDDESYDAYSGQWDELESKFYDLWNNDTSLERLFPEEEIHPTDAENDKALGEIEKEGPLKVESATKDEKAWEKSEERMSNMPKPIRDMIQPDWSDSRKKNVKEDKKESSENDSERLHRELKRGPVFAQRSASMKTAGPGAISIRVPNQSLLPDNDQWTNRFHIRSESSDRVYTVAQNKSGGWWGCNCMGWIRHKNCKHLRELGLPGNHQPAQAQISGTTTRYAKSSKEETMKLPASAKVNTAKGKTSADKFTKFREIAKSHPQDVQQVLEEFRDTFAMMASKTNAMIKNLNLVTGADATTLKEKVAAKRTYAAGLRKMADEMGGPGAFAEALGQMYQQLDDVADGIEAVAENLGVALPTVSPEPMDIADPMMGDGMGMGDEDEIDPTSSIEAPASTDTDQTLVPEGAPAAPAAPLPDAVPTVV